MLHHYQSNHQNKTQIKKLTNIPNDPEIITINVPRLHGVFIVLKHNLNEIMKRSLQHRCSYMCRTIRWSGLNITEDSRNVEVISKFKRGIRVNIGDTINCITELSIDQWCWIRQIYSFSWNYLSIMEWSLWVRPSSICCQIPSARIFNFKQIKNYKQIKANSQRFCFYEEPNFDNFRDFLVNTIQIGGNYVHYMVNGYTRCLNPLAWYIH